jgi:hypothetical protein
MARRSLLYRKTAQTYGLLVPFFEKISNFHSIAELSMPYQTNTQYESYTQRKQIVSGYETLIQEIIDKWDAEAYFVNFMFHQLPGKESTKISIMTKDVTRFHGLLKRHVVRKFDKPGWRDLVPALIGAPDFPVPKTLKSDVRLLRVNDGLHFNAVVLLPPRFEPPKIIGERQSRLEESLVLHVKRFEYEYLTDKLYSIYVMPLVEGTTMADYTLKAFVRGRINSSDILILNR